jgi:tRNA(adenine34) deaminase
MSHSADAGATGATGAAAAADPVGGARVPGPAAGRPESFEPAMRLALAEARRAGATDVPVGAVILDRDATVIARAANRREADGDPTAHAELVALRAAARVVGNWRLIGCTLVVTLEPCTMCAGAVTLARVDRLVFGASDPKAGAVGSLWDVVADRRLNHHPEVIAGVLAAECGALLREFFAARRTC